MKTIVLGYEGHDTSGRGTGLAKMLCGPDVSANEQHALVAGKKFPAGVRFAEIVRLHRLFAAGLAAEKPIEPKQNKEKSK